MIQVLSIEGAALTTEAVCVGVMAGVGAAWVAAEAPAPSWPASHAVRAKPKVRIPSALILSFTFVMLYMLHKGCHYVKLSTYGIGTV